MTDDPRLTAYALDDPSLTADDRREVESLLAADTAAAKLVADTRDVAAMLATGLKAELGLPAYDANRPSDSVTPLSLRVREEKATALAWRGSFALASSVLIAAGSVLFVMASAQRGGVALKSPIPISVVEGLDEKGSNAGSGGVFEPQTEPTPMPPRAATPPPYAGVGGGIGGGIQGGIGGGIGGIGGGIGGIGGGIGGGGIGGGIGGYPAPKSSPPPSITAPGNVAHVPIKDFDPTKLQDSIHAMNGQPMTRDQAQAFKAASDRAEIAKQNGVTPLASAPAPGSGAGKDSLNRFRKGLDDRAKAGEGGTPPVTFPQTGAGQFAGGSPAGESARRSTQPHVFGDLFGGFGPGGAPGGTDPLAVARSKSMEANLRGDSPSPANFRGTNRFVAQDENPFVVAEGQNALSTFGVDVDTASYSIVRKFLSNGQRPPAAAIRLEELVNYFPYRDAPPTGDDPYKVTVELAECPWQPGHKLARIGLKAKPINHDKRPASNLVFLVDVSGSMDEPNKLPWVKQSLAMLVEQLKENDRVGLVVYAGSTGVVLDSTTAAKKGEILSALDRLKAGGGTNGGAGIDLAYEMAAKHFIEGGTNRVILCTDGDWNVGTTSTESLIQLIEAKRKSGVFLSVLGYGMGNLRDEMMVKLAGKGNGNYAYIDDLKEARKVLVEQLGGTLVTVAKDVKIQIEFNPARVSQYRLLGYEKRALATKDFADDKKDAGEMGAGHVVTALYELVPTAVAATKKAEEELKYQPKPVAPAVKAVGPAGEAFTVKLRHKLPASDVSTLRELPVSDVTKPYAEASEDFRFSAAVASFAMLLRESPYQGNATYGLVAELANAAKTFDPGEYRAEFVKLIDAAKRVTGKP